MFTRHVHTNSKMVTHANFECGYIRKSGSAIETINNMNSVIPYLFKGASVFNSPACLIYLSLSV